MELDPEHPTCPRQFSDEGWPGNSVDPGAVAFYGGVEGRVRKVGLAMDGARRQVPLDFPITFDPGSQIGPGWPPVEAEGLEGPGEIEDTSGWVLGADGHGPRVRPVSCFYNDVE